LSEADWFSAIALVKQLPLNWVLIISGGEPTIHPRIVPWVEQLTSEMGQRVVLLPTNGKKTAVAREIRDLALQGDHNLQLILSLDSYHEPINPETVRLWETNNRHLSIGRVDTPEPLGRALDNGLSDPGHKPSCISPYCVLGVDGTVWACGCKMASLGHISRVSAEVVIQSTDMTCKALVAT